MHVDTHPCPGCRQPGVPFERLACRKCWFVLPQEIRNRIWRYYRSNAVQHHQAVRDALRWYAERDTV
jgi:hypothetical protein